MPNLTLDLFLDAAEKFEVAEKEALVEWRSACNCSAPSTRVECQTCPYHKKLGRLIQEKIASSTEQTLAKILPLKHEDPYVETVKQKCLEMYDLGYSIQDIQTLVGIPLRRRLRNWLREVGLPGLSFEHTEELKQECLQRYIDGYTPRQIEDLTGIPSDTITLWAVKQGITSRYKYPKAVKDECLELYASGKSTVQIEDLTGVDRRTVQSWVAGAGIGRKQKRYSESEKQHCLKLYLEGKSFAEVERLTGIKKETIASWARKAEISRGNKR